jgi:AcrR family transcriptional regulator
MNLSDITTLSPYRKNKREAMTARILNAARQIMREDGAAALSMHELARRLDLRAPSLYNYYQSKMDIYDSLYRLGFEMFAEQARAAAQGAETWQDALRLQLEVYLGFALQNPDLFQLCFERPVPGFVPSEESLNISFGLLKEMIGLTEDLLPQMDSGLEADQLVNLMIAIMHGLAASHLANEPHLPIGEGRFGSLVPVVMAVLEKAWKRN